jgi:hypothetical protein
MALLGVFFAFGKSGSLPPMPRDGAMTFGHLLGRRDSLDIVCGNCSAPRFTTATIRREASIQQRFLSPAVRAGVARAAWRAGAQSGKIIRLPRHKMDTGGAHGE